MPSSHDLEQDGKIARLEHLVVELIADGMRTDKQIGEIGERLAVIEARLEKKNKKEKKDE